MIHWFFCFCAVLSLASCIQVPLGIDKVEQYKNVMFSNPKPSFTKSSSFRSDHSWVHNQSGAVISYKSECSKQSLDAKDFLQNITNEFYTHSITEIQSFKFNSRKAYRQKLQTEVEGIPTKFDLVVFKKYGCVFLVTHTSVAEVFEQTSESFQNFLTTFKVQR